MVAESQVALLLVVLALEENYWDMSPVPRLWDTLPKSGRFFPSSPLLQCIWCLACFR